MVCCHYFISFLIVLNSASYKLHVGFELEISAAWTFIRPARNFELLKNIWLSLKISAT